MILLLLAILAQADEYVNLEQPLISTYAGNDKCLIYMNNLPESVAVYDVYRSINSNMNFKKIGIVTQVDNTFIDDTAPKGVVIYYRVDGKLLSSNEAWCYLLKPDQRK